MREKVDKGFCLNYWRLSYRRKLIRTLWILPAILLIQAIIVLRDPRYGEFFTTPLAMVLIALIMVLWVIQAAYNYTKWRQATAE